MKKILTIILSLFISNTVFANTLTLNTIKHLEGFQDTCKPDNYQISGGYGSGFLCKDSKGRYQAGKKITKQMAEAQLKKDYQMFKRELLIHLKSINKKRNLNLYYTSNEINAMIILMYQKGWGNMIKNGFEKDLVNYKLGLSGGLESIKSFTKMSCYKNAKTEVSKYNLGLYKRHYATAKMFQNKVSTLDDFSKYQSDAINDVRVLHKTISYCNSKN